MEAVQEGSCCCSQSRGKAFPRVQHPRLSGPYTVYSAKFLPFMIRKVTANALGAASKIARPQQHAQSSLVKRERVKRDFALIGTQPLASGTLSQYKLRWFKGILLLAGLFSCDFNVPLNQI
jgi:hypothetical protein